MAALTKDRDTVRLGKSIYDKVSYPAKAGQTFYKGGLVTMAAGAAGQVVPASGSGGSTNSFVVGRSLESKTAVAGDTCLVDVGTFFFNNSSGTEEFKAEDVGLSAFVVDDSTVSKSSSNGTRPFAGRVAKINSGTIDRPGYGVAITIEPTFIMSSSRAAP
jgi:hypothetical protein